MFAFFAWLPVEMSNGTYERSRKRFGPDEYWKQVNSEVEIKKEVK